MGDRDMQKTAFITSLAFAICVVDANGIFLIHDCIFSCRFGIYSNNAMQAQVSRVEQSASSTKRMLGIKILHILLPRARRFRVP